MAIHRDLRTKLIARAGHRCECTLCANHEPGGCRCSVEKGEAHCIVPGQSHSLGNLEFLCEVCYRLAVEFDDRYATLAAVSSGKAVRELT